MSDETISDMAELEQIVTRLRQLSGAQRLIERARSRYAEWYEVASEELAPPERVHIAFRLQTLYFQPGVSTRLPAYITTTVELSVPGEDFGLYSLFTNLDGSYRDDVMIWASTLTYHPTPDYKVNDPIEPVELRNVPPELMDICPKIAHLASHQHLADRATERCLEWFQRHPDWHQQFPFSLAAQAIKQDWRWFHADPLWYQRYPANLFEGPEIRVGLDRQTLCFNHASYDYPHLKTYLNIYANGYNIGTYCLVTRPDGTIDEQLSMIAPFPFEREL